MKKNNITMSLEGMPLSDENIEMLSKIIDGELTIEESFAILNKKYGLKV